MASMARACIEALDKRSQDITMLWLLSAPDAWLQHCKAGRELEDWARNIMKVPSGVFKSIEFQAEVSREFTERGVRPVAPKRVVDSWKKDKAKDMCLSAGWPRPFFPVMLQTRPASAKQGAGAFVVFSSWQDAAVALVRMSRTKRYEGRDRSYPADMVYENQLVDMDGYDFPCRIILDCDAKPSEFGDKYSVEELSKIIDGVPEWFVRRLVEVKAIGEKDRVVVVEKEKSRPDKASRHYVFSIMAFSTWDTQAVLRRIFDEEAEREAAKRTKGPPACWRLVDRVPHHGRGQYSVLGFFDRKKKETEYPCLTQRMEIVNGVMTSRRASRNTDRRESGLTTGDALRRLQEACYSFLKPGFVTMNPTYMVQRDLVNCFINSLP